MHLSTGFTSSLIIVAALALSSCDQSTPTYPGATAAEDKSVVAPVADSAVPVAISDANISNDVKTALLRDEKLKNFDITVVSTKGDVLLTGVLNSQSQINQAILITEGVVGVKAVHDELSIN